MESHEVKYENLLMPILQDAEKIEPFLDSVFNFLHKRFAKLFTFFVFVLI
jgi:hypothetical protein